MSNDDERKRVGNKEDNNYSNTRQPQVRNIQQPKKALKLIIISGKTIQSTFTLLVERLIDVYITVPGTVRTAEKRAAPINTLISVF